MLDEAAPSSGRQIAPSNGATQVFACAFSSRADQRSPFGGHGGLELALDMDQIAARITRGDQHIAMNRRAAMSGSRTACRSFCVASVTPDGAIWAVV